MRTPSSFLPLIGLLIFLQVGCGPTSTHPANALEEIEPLAVTLFTPQLELFMEHPRLIRGQEARFLAHLTVLATGEPVRSGTLVLEAVPASGAPVTLRADRPARDGLFVPEGVFAAAGKYRVRLILESPQAAATIDVGDVVVHPDEASARRAAEADSQPDPPHAVPFLLESQWKIGLLLAEARHRPLVERLQVPGELHAPQGAAAVVSPPVSGLLRPPPSSGLPRVGEHVKAGQLLAFIEPPLPVAQQVQSLAIELSLRSFDLDMKRLEAERAVAQSKTRVDFAQRAYKRITALRAKELATRQQLEDAEQNLRLAESETTAAATIKDSYDQAAEKLGKLRTQAQQGLSVEAFRIPLVAPITGVVVAAHHIEGEHLEAHAEVFRLINTDDVLLVARVSEFDLARVPNAPAAVMTLPAYPGRRFEILGDANGRLLGIGKVVDPDSRTVQIRYQLPNPQGLFRVGMLADVFLETESVLTALAVPEDAVVTDLGKTVMFALVHGELFQRREVTLGIRDGGFVEVKQGLAEGERVVTRGAYTVKLAALSPESFSHGHAH